MGVLYSVVQMMDVLYFHQNFSSPQAGNQPSVMNIPLFLEIGIVGDLNFSIWRHLCFVAGLGIQIR